MYTSVLISLFSLSLLGGASMVAYKIISLRRREIEHPTAEGQHSLEHHLGAFLRATGKRYAIKAYLWVKNVLIPVAVYVVRKLARILTRLFEKVRVKIVERMQWRDHGNTASKGAVSFFLKDITEHKKNSRGESGEGYF